MSSTAATDFIQRVGEDQQLYDRMHQALGNFGQVELVDSVGQKVVNIGQETGFDFSVDEIKAAFSQFREQELTATEGELDEAQLDAVSGGGSGYCKSSAVTPTPTKTQTPVTRINPNAIHCTGLTVHH